MKTKDNEINKILDRAKNYRKDLSKSMNEFGNFKNLKVEELQKEFQEERNEFKIEDKRNIFVQCKITKDEANKGCIRKIRYNRITTKETTESNEIFTKIPKGTKVGQNIVIYGEGNYVKELNKNSDLIIEII